MNSGSKALRVPSGSIEGLKYFAALLMVGDHTNKYLFNGTLPYFYELGRLAFPIFVFVVAYNLSRPGVMHGGGYHRMMVKLAVFFSIACLPMYGLNTLLPLNVLATLFVLVFVTYCLEKKHLWSAVIAYVVLGCFVEYSWIGVALGLSTWLHMRVNKLSTAVVAIFCCAGMSMINGNYWAMAAIPIVVLISRFDINIPRNKWIFYAFYPFHLGVLWLIRIPLSKAGYLFFT